MIKQIRVAILGYGVVGRRRHHYIAQRTDMVVVGVCDKTLASTPMVDGLPAVEHYNDIWPLKPDAVFVCMTNDIAPEVTIAALERGVHVFCEKPPGRDMTDMAALKSAAERHKTVVLKYGFNHRYHESVGDALAVIRSGNMGRILNLRGVYGKSRFISFQDRTGWRTRRDVAGGGILLDQGIHMLDLMRLFAGEFTDVHSIVSNAYWNHDVEDNAYALMRADGGAVAMLHSSATQWRHRFTLEIGLERGALVLGGILSSSKSYGAETLTKVWPDTGSSGDQGDPREETTRYNHDPSWALEIEEFANAILAGSQVMNGTIDDAYRTMALVYRIYCADSDWKQRWHLSDTQPETQKESTEE